jgi:hypothetical protein
MVVEDLDLLIRWYGKQFRQDDKGRFMFVEIKHGYADLSGGQTHTWSLIDWLLSKADPEHKRYRGFFLIQCSDEDWQEPGCQLRLNKHPIALGDLHHFLLGVDVGCPSYFKDGNITPWKDE